MKNISKVRRLVDTLVDYKSQKPTNTNVARSFKESSFKGKNEPISTLSSNSHTTTSK